MINPENKFFNIPQDRWMSEYPPSFTPKKSKIFAAVDIGLNDKSYVTRGFYKDGHFHIQEVEYSK